MTSRRRAASIRLGGAVTAGWAMGMAARAAGRRPVRWTIYNRTRSKAECPWQSLGGSIVDFTGCLGPAGDIVFTIVVHLGGPCCMSGTVLQGLLTGHAGRPPSLLESTASSVLGGRPRLDPPPSWRIGGPASDGLLRR